MRWSLQQIAEVTGGRLTGGAEGVEVAGLSIDSRTVKSGELFVAIKGERDGHDYVGSAAAGGAAAIMVERPTEAGVPAVMVDSTARALLDIGRAARRRLDAPSVGITGSVGKTSTKDLVAAALGSRMRTVASPRSFNNELGVPLTLGNADENVQVAVLEMGARGPGHIALLCSIARPTVGVVTAVAAAHTEMFKDLDAVATAKGELVEALPRHGLAVLNGDDHRVRSMAGRGPAPAIFYSVTGGADVRAEEITVDSLLRPSFRAMTPWGRATVRLEARGRHQVGNALAALAVASHLGVELESAAAALATARLSPWRMEVKRARSGAIVVNDSYNANPSSVAAALRSLAELPVRRKVAVLGTMAELGDDTAEEHEAVARLASELGIELIAVGTDLYGVAPVQRVEIPDAGPDMAILVKGSRVVGLERLAAELIDGKDSA
jgi:UDP-N-acetylmuramoyl-tripeptide--D-alanyl-D-alanine ligase